MILKGTKEPSFHSGSQDLQPLIPKHSVDLCEINDNIGSKNLDNSVFGSGILGVVALVDICLYLSLARDVASDCLIHQASTQP